MAAHAYQDRQPDAHRINLWDRGTPTSVTVVGPTWWESLPRRVRRAVTLGSVLFVAANLTVLVAVLLAVLGTVGVATGGFGGLVPLPPYAGR